ncbi:putative Diguanylate cyclase [Magnetospirillum gryphiswaldense MSR-1 v2]|uniref:diguanylate cyclase n=1 Tax=Magnetospirillum gryphiswaldense (strain DSM 6361 / JCM 21280 / NBRC 15271 / MSR-1) TaxID=431944 RepID=V6F332_MAGGM|nr:GGDEF domain-containing protein [Magnetospirillum gryphiswaldense]CDK99782.1 putative Diguanylate cyclase [Magnetospirillum gryphiswaldense MSR-1 v2]
MSVTEYLYGMLAGLTALAALVVAVRLLAFTIRCRAREGRLLVMLAGATTLFALCGANLVNAADNVLWHPNVPIVPSAWLSSVSGLVICVWFEVFGRYAVERSGFERQLEALANTDSLTGILNRRACLERGAALVEAARRFDHPLTVMMIDIDHFKRVNDRHGHEAGDEVLRMFTSVVQGCLRQVDVFGRLGGEEFAVFMPETNHEGAAIAAERIRASIEKAELSRNGKALSITVSIGAIAGSESLDEALRKADEALYRAKQTGRNRAVMVSETLGEPA